MITTLAISGYRSIRDLQLPLGRLNLVTGANGSGKSSLYRALRLLGDAAQNSVVASLAREGGLPSTLWAGPETIARSMKLGEHPVQATRRLNPIALKLGFSGDEYGYSIELGPPKAGLSAFPNDPDIKRECIWHGPIYRRASALVDRRNRLVTLPEANGDESVMLTMELNWADSMLATIADPQRAPEMLTVRESIRRWRFYDGFRTDIDSPVRSPRIGTYTPVLGNAGADLASALATIVSFGDPVALAKAIDDAFPGSTVEVDESVGRLELKLQQHGLLRPLSAAELSDGTLRFLLWTAALLSPRPSELMVLNEPETSLHPDLLPALARLIAAAAERCQIIVVSHAPILIEQLANATDCRRLHLEKSFGETILADADRSSGPRWAWPPR
jgi:predicted ATPase